MEPLFRILLQRRFRRLLLVAVPVVLVACACALVVSLEGRADAHSRYAEQLQRIEVLTTRVSAQEWQAVAEGEVSDAASRDVELALEEMSAALAVQDEHARRSHDAEVDRHSDESPLVTLAEYSSAVRDEFDALRDGDLEEAEEIDEERVDPAFERLEVVVENLSQTEAADAASGHKQALIGSLLAIVLSSSALVGLMLAMFRARGRIEMAELQQRMDRESERRVAALLQNSSDLLLVLDGASAIKYASNSIDQLLGYQPGSVIGGELREILKPESHDASASDLERASARPGDPVVAEWAAETAEGDLRYVEAILNDLSADPQVAGIVVNVRDITERRRLEAELRRRAFHDDLTGLANRTLFEDRLSGALADADRSGVSPGVIFLDLDDFKHVNDSLGHSSGDELLRIVATRLQTCVRDQDTIARLGGDEFAVLVRNVESMDRVVDVAERVLAELSTPVFVQGNALFVNASIGVALDPAPGEDRHERVQAMLRDADIAMYAAKGAGKHRLEVFESELHAPVLRRLQLKSELQTALDRNQLVLHFQPIVSLDDEEMIGAEALVRWEHPERGLIPPGEFIPLAEQTGLTVPLGRWVLREALRNAASWRDQDATSGLRYVSVNVTGHQLESPTFLRDVRDALDAVGLPSEALVIEVTESSLIHDSERNRERLQALRDLGVRLAIDDFGTGYSALNYLRRFPMDVLKIDRSFIEHVAEGGQDAALVQAMLQMSESLGLKVVAEGVETSGQCDRLQELDCGYGQGYFFSRPVPAEELRALLERTTSTVAP